MRYTPDDGHGESVQMFSIELNNSQIAELHSRVEPASRGGGNDRPSESLSFSFGKITMNASSQDEGGGYGVLNPDDAIGVDNPALEDR